MKNCLLALEECYLCLGSGSELRPTPKAFNGDDSSALLKPTCAILTEAKKAKHVYRANAERTYAYDDHVVWLVVVKLLGLTCCRVDLHQSLNAKYNRLMFYEKQE